MALPPSEIRKLSKSQLEQSDIEYFQERYGKRFIRALRAVEERKVTECKFHPSDTVKWIVTGRTKEYLVIPEVFCTCRDFYQAVVINGEVTMCYHLLAQKIAAVRDTYKTVEMTDADRRRLYSEWRRVS